MEKIPDSKLVRSKSQYIECLSPLHLPFSFIRTHKQLSSIVVFPVAQMNRDLMLIVNELNSIYLFMVHLNCVYCLIENVMGSHYSYSLLDVSLILLQKHKFIERHICFSFCEFSVFQRNLSFVQKQVYSKEDKMYFHKLQQKQNNEAQ